MRREVKTYLITCDYCHTTTVHVEGKPKADGWIEVDARCYGSDHYYEDGYPCKKDWCGECREGMTLERR